MSHLATLNYSKPLLRQAVFVFWRRTVGIGIPVAIVVGAAGVTVLSLEGDSSWVVGAARSL